MPPSTESIAAGRLAHPNPMHPDICAMSMLPFRVWCAAWCGYCQAWMDVMSPRGRS